MPIKAREIMNGQTNINEFTCKDKIPVEESTFTITPEGIYEGEYVGTAKRLNDDGNSFYMHKWKVKKKDGTILEHIDLTGTRITENTKLGKMFLGLGFTLTPNTMHDLEELKGKKCQLVIKIIKKNGKEKNETDFVKF